MYRRLNCCRFAKLSAVFAVILYLCAFSVDLDSIMDGLRWIYHSWSLLSFSHKIIILNSLPSTARHPMAPPYPHPYPFLINQPGKCLNRKPFLVLLVTVESHDIISRNTIRETWGDETNYPDVDVLRLFLVGRPPMVVDAGQRLLEEESALYGDIVQQDFLDTYDNLTLKSLMGMQWVAKYCPNASYVMKVDSDVFLNVNYLVHHLLHPELPAHENYITGYFVYHTGPIRNKFSKWYIPHELYPGDTFPPYPSGPGYVFSADMAKKIYDVAQGIIVINLEDVFIGMCLHRLNILPTRPPRNMFNGQRTSYTISTFCNVVMVHHYEKHELRRVWLDFWSRKTLAFEIVRKHWSVISSDQRLAPLFKEPPMCAFKRSRRVCDTLVHARNMPVAEKRNTDFAR
ncbi:beta-1,3-galactosyltransferase 1-like [Hyperolius riggenbachi]|uniref:beta-1,3-galactosyltransferase 1-like n=1 Tax=Hyperolius riggenbachi TaxID=752182 RepID=UPI0035A2812B